MSVQTQHRFSVSDYHRMAETGVLGPGARVELLDGKIIDMSPIGPFHGGLVKRLSRFFNLQARGRWIVSTQDPLRLDDHSEPEPDIMLLRPRSDDYTGGHPGPSDVLLLVEVSDSTLEYDRGEKLSAYANAGIVETWIVNLDDLTLEIYREPGFTGYASKDFLKPGSHAKPSEFPDVAVDVAALLQR